MEVVDLSDIYMLCQVPTTDRLWGNIQNTIWTSCKIIAYTALIRPEITLVLNFLWHSPSNKFHCNPIRTFGDEMYGQTDTILRSLYAIRGKRIKILILAPIRATRIMLVPTNIHLVTIQQQLRKKSYKTSDI
jgi:hypothetical protein